MTSREALALSGLNLQTIRISKRFSIEALAVLSGVDASIIEAMESGYFDFKVNTMMELANTLNVHITEILVDPTA